MEKNGTDFANEKGVSDQKEMRSLSNKLDDYMGWEDEYKETIAFIVCWFLWYFKNKLN